jgi:hypothetical protein
MNIRSAKKKLALVPALLEDCTTYAARYVVVLKGFRASAPDAPWKLIRQQDPSKQPKRLVPLAAVQLASPGSMHEVNAFQLN